MMSWKCADSPIWSRVLRMVLVPLMVLLPSTALYAEGYDGKTLMRGLYFGYGPVADEIPEIRNELKLEDYILDGQALNEVIDRAEAILDEIAQDDPGYLNRWAAEIQSGDQWHVADALQSGADVVARAMTRLPEFQAAFQYAQENPQEFRAAVAEYNERLPQPSRVGLDEVEAMIERMSEGNVPPYGIGACVVAAFVAVVWVVAAADIAAAVIQVAAVQTAVAVTTWRYRWVPEQVVPAGYDKEYMQLLYEQLIQSITMRLAT